MPRQFALRGDRLAFSYGIITLASLAAGLIVIFGGTTHLLIPLYAVGVFIDFTISQTGMIRHWLRERSPGYRRRLAINAFGAVADRRRRGHRDRGEVLRRGVAGPGPDPDPGRDHVVHPPPVRAPGGGAATSATRASCPGRIASSGSSSRSTGSIAPSSRRSTSGARSPATSGPSTSPTTSTWPTRCAPAGSGSCRTSRWSSSSRRSGRSSRRSIAYLDILDQAWPPDKEAPITIVVLPEYVARHWWDRMLYNQTAKRLKTALLGREHTVIADVPYRRGH